MRAMRSKPASLAVVFAAGFPIATATVSSQTQTIRIRAATLLDGTGKVLRNATIVVQGSKITSVENGSASAATYDLGSLTVIPGMIDVHAHVGWHFDKEGRYAARRGLPGPRILTSIRQINENSGTPDEIREMVRQLKKDGADVVKIFASASIRDGGKQTMTDAQIDAVCGEAKAQGMRTMVHAHSPESIKASVNAGCNQIEHGVFATEEVLKLMADKGVYFDPNVGVVLQNYLRNK